MPLLLASVRGCGRLLRRVRDAPSDDRYRKEAAFSVIVATEDAIRVAEQQGELAPMAVLKSTDRDPEAVVTPQPVPPSARRW